MKTLTNHILEGVACVLRGDATPISRMKARAVSLLRPHPGLALLVLLQFCAGASAASLPSGTAFCYRVRSFFSFSEINYFRPAFRDGRGAPPRENPSFKHYPVNDMEPKLVKKCAPLAPLAFACLHLCMQAAHYCAVLGAGAPP